jgi:peptidoglycan/xylan/chitin deacetylase (PgdA/CDA1 family)
MPSFSGRFARSAARWIPPGLSRGFAGPAAVFFHGVETAPEGLEKIHHRADIFFDIAKSLKRHFDVLPMASMRDVLKNPSRHARALFITFDDGYANTKLAADILENLDLPWTLFVSTHHIETGARNPAFLARLFFHHAPNGEYAIPHLGRIILGTAAQRELQVNTGLNALKFLDAARANEALATMLANFAPDTLARLLEEFPSEKFLNWTELRALAQRGVEIGAHAHRHWPMHAGQSRDYLTEQARKPREMIEAQIGRCRFFAYPFGTPADVGADAHAAVRDAGYEFAFTTVSGTLTASADPWLMPRYGVGLEETTLASMIGLLRANNARLISWQRKLAPVSA